MTFQNSTGFAMHGYESDAIAAFQTPIETEVRTEVTLLSSLENKISELMSNAVKQLTNVIEKVKSERSVNVLKIHFSSQPKIRV